MEKDFDSWIGHKNKTNIQVKRALFTERDIWWCSIGANVGDEEDGKGKYFSRPVLVFKKFNHNIFLGIPLSTIIKEKKFYYIFNFKGIPQSLLLSQIRIFDAKRLRERMGNITTNEFDAIKAKVRELVF